MYVDIGPIVGRDALAELLAGRWPAPPLVLAELEATRRDSETDRAFHAPKPKPPPNPNPARPKPRPPLPAPKPDTWPPDRGAEGGEAR